MKVGDIVKCTEYDSLPRFSQHSEKNVMDYLGLDHNSSLEIKLIYLDEDYNVILDVCHDKVEFSAHDKYFTKLQDIRNDKIKGILDGN